MKNTRMTIAGMAILMALCLQSAAQDSCNGKEPNVIINTSCLEVCMPNTYKPDTATCKDFMMTATGATQYTWSVNNVVVATTSTLYFYPTAVGVTNYVVTGALYYNGKPCYGSAVISITTVACSKTIVVNPPPTTGLVELSPPELPPAYYDLTGNRVEKRHNVLLIEQVGLRRRKIIFTAP